MNRERAGNNHNKIRRAGLASVSDSIKNVLRQSNSGWLFSPEIPEKKLNGACGSYAKVEPGKVVALFDSTLFGSASEGLVLTGANLYYASLSDSFSFAYEQIEEVRLLEEEKSTFMGGKKTEYSIRISLKDNRVKRLEGIISTSGAFDYKALSGLLRELSQQNVEFEEADESIPVADEEAAVKKAYVQIMAVIAMSNDGVVDSKEYAEIMQLMTRLDLSKEERYVIREDILGGKFDQDLDRYIGVISQALPEVRFSSIRVSIMKDAINLYRAQTGKNTYEKGGFRESAVHVALYEKLRITDQELELIEDSIINDLKILNDRDVTDDKIKGFFTEMAAKAGAVGVPLAAVYLTGTVGLSAAGLTSGLAALGLGGVLGFSSMVTGIGVAVLIGVVSYKVVGAGIRKVTGDDSEKYRQREFFLQGVIRNTQRSINFIVEDVNYLTQKLKSAIFDSAKTAELHSIEISRLALQLEQVTAANQTLVNQEQFAAREELLIHLPKIIDKSRVEFLTTEPTKKPLGPVIMEFYGVTTEAGEDGSEKEIYRLSESISYEECEDLNELLTAIGYFDVGSIASQGAKQAMDKFASIFKQ